ncbi:hypothetical protein DL770_003655 [Monosporascus sp. CRB-9-2]|nr:hypothetical protein DL770_003655 [Monosporascus sp. CRB-9-2]
MYALIAGVTVAIIVATLIVCKHFVYPVFLSPLASLPAAHPLAHITSLWIQWQRFRGSEFQCIAAAFASKGPYVRLGPRELAVNDIDAVGSAWGAGSANFDKHPSYLFFMTHGTPNTFTTLLSSEHRRRRRRVRIVYSRAFLLTSPHMRAILVGIILDRLRPLLARIAGSPLGATDVMPLAQSYVLDFVSAFGFGLPLGLDFLSDSAAHKRWLDLYNLSFPGGTTGFWLKEHPWLTRLLCSLGVPMIPDGYAKSRRELENWAIEKVDAAEKLLQWHREKNSMAAGELPVLYDAVRSGMAQADGFSGIGNFTPSPAQRLELASECLDHIGEWSLNRSERPELPVSERKSAIRLTRGHHRAASTGETFGTTFTYMIYELSRHMDVQRELRKELHSIDNPFRDTSNHTGLPASEALERLPFLDAIIKESLRLRNTSPNLDPRVSPAHCTSHLGRISCLPPGIRVGTYGWWLNRNPHVYPDPDSWRPNRWLRGGSEDAAVLNRWLFAFSSGSRGCVGQPIAMELLRMGLAAIYTSYTTSIADEREYPGANQSMSAYCTDKLFICFKYLST